MISTRNNATRKPSFNLKKLKEKAVRLETDKEGRVILDKNNPKHVEWHNE